MSTTADKTNSCEGSILAGLQMKIVSAKRVSLRTLGLGCIPSCKALPSSSVGFVSNYFQMDRIHTVTHSAQVVKLMDSARSRPNKKFVGNTVGIDHFGIDTEMTIPIVDKGTFPQPARLVWADIHQSPESSNYQWSERGEWYRFHVMTIPRMGLAVN